MTQNSDDIPLKVLVCDTDDSARVLSEALARQPKILEVRQAGDVKAASDLLLGGPEERRSDINTIFIDPLTLGLDQASQFIFRIRNELPEIVFVLYIDRSRAESRRASFYRGDRQRFSHYYVLDKQTPIDSFEAELRSVVRLCRSDLSWRMSKTAIERVRYEAERLATASTEAREQDVAEQLEEVRALLHELAAARDVARGAPQSLPVRTNTVFVSYRFSEDEYFEGLGSLLTANEFDVVTGEAADTYISRAVLDRIKECEYFLSLLTRDAEKSDGTYTTSPWLIEEKGAAIALGKRLVLMVEEGVTDIGGLQGDWQRIHFVPKGFLKAAMKAVHQLREYAGRS